MVYGQFYGVRCRATNNSDREGVGEHIAAVFYTFSYGIYLGNGISENLKRLVYKK